MNYLLSGGRQTCWLYDFLLTRGGAEHVTLQVAHAWPQVDVQVATINEALFGEDANTVSSLSEQQPLKNPLARTYQTGRIFRRNADHLDNYDVVVFSGMYSPQAILSQAVSYSIYYAHTIPLPFAFDWEEDYLRNLPAGPARAWFRRFAKHQRTFYSECMSRMDRVIANSHFVASRYKQHFGISPQVIYPPVDTSGFEWLHSGDEFVIVSTLARHKRVDLAIKAFTGLPDQTLRIIGDGPESKRLKAMAAEQGNVIFEGSCDRERVQALMGKCRAVLCLSRDEAFGIVVIEALACGKPVIAVGEGSYNELINEDETGKLIPAKIGALQSAILKMTSARALNQKSECQRIALNYRPDKFFASMGDVLAR